MARRPKQSEVEKRRREALPDLPYFDRATLVEAGDVFSGYADRWIGQYKEGYWEPHHILARLVEEEVGELSREVNHEFGPKRKKKSEIAGGVAEELSDILFTIVCLANSRGINLGACFADTLAKYNKRDTGRFKRKK
ncbi:MAG: nucleotide pyrophosphohydrolase [Parcubacteria group bacterium]|nr:nucleotide pyrophosphohydrolase [Parcubacteria group bacterium]